MNIRKCRTQNRPVFDVYCILLYHERGNKSKDKTNIQQVLPFADTKVTMLQATVERKSGSIYFETHWARSVSYKRELSPEAMLSHDKMGLITYKMSYVRGPAYKCTWSRYSRVQTQGLPWPELVAPQDKPLQCGRWGISRRDTAERAEVLTVIEDEGYKSAPSGNGGQEAVRTICGFASPSTTPTIRFEPTRNSKGFSCRLAVGGGIPTRANTPS